jgi:hypothetical protein
MIERKSTFQPETDMAAVLDCIEKGDTRAQIRARTGMSAKTVNQTIKEMEDNKGTLTHYREVQSLQLTTIQQKLLAAMDDDDKIDSCSIPDLAQAFGVLKKNEHMLDGKPTEIKGLIAYLVHIEDEELKAKELPDGESIIDVSPEPEVEEEVTPNL